MSKPLGPRTKKDNSRKSGAAADHKINKRKEAEARQVKYNNLSLVEKFSRAGAKQLIKLEVAYGKKSS